MRQTNVLNDPTAAEAAWEKVRSIEPELTKARWEALYAPEKRPNTCCEHCSRCGSSKCEWDALGQSVPGWVADEAIEDGLLKAAKIYYCPKYEREPSCKIELDYDGCLKLLIAFAGETGDAYRNILNHITEKRELYRSDPERYCRDEDFLRDFSDFNIWKTEIENLLYSHVALLKEKAGFEDDDLDREILECYGRLNRRGRR